MTDALAPTSVSLEEQSSFDRASYEEFVRDLGPILRRALIARFGVDVGRDAADEALLHAWKNWQRIGRMASPVGYLYRVGQSAARPNLGWWRRRTRLDLPREPAQDNRIPDIDLFDGLRRLTESQRVAVTLVKAHGYTYSEAAELMGVSEAAVGNHVRRGLATLRRILEDQ